MSSKFVTIRGVLTEGGGPVDPGYSPPWARPEPPHPAHPIVIPPGFIPGTPEHPIVLPPPDAPVPMPPIYIEGDHPEHPIVIIPPGAIDGVHPEHPIVIPPTIWGPTDPRPSHPIVIPPDTIPGFPAHPIVIPPGEPGVPAHPIVIPPDEPPKPLENWDVKTYWTPVSGWGVAIVPSEEHPGTPTPSRRRG